MLLALVMNCMSVIVETHPNANVKLLSGDDPVNYYGKFKCWYLLWGLGSISNISTADVIKEYELKNVRVTTYFSGLDFLVAYFTAGFVVSHTVIIEGNTDKKIEEDTGDD